MSAHTTNIYAHTAFVVIAGLLSLQGCSKPAAAAPAPAETALGAEHIAAASQVDRRNQLHGRMSATSARASRFAP